MKNLYLASLLSSTAESFRQATSSKTEPLFKFWWKTNCKAAYARLKQGRKYSKTEAEGNIEAKTEAEGK